MDLLANSAMAGTVAMVLKSVIGILKVGIDPPRWVAPATALIGGPLVMMLLVIAQGMEASAQNLAGAVLGGIMAGATAIGVAAIQDNERKEPEPAPEPVSEPPSGPLLLIPDDEARS